MAFVEAKGNTEGRVEALGLSHHWGDEGAIAEGGDRVGGGVAAWAGAGNGGLNAEDSSSEGVGV